MIWPGILLAFAILFSGCNFAPIPSFQVEDTGLVAEPDALLSGPVCEPNRSICVGNAVSICSPDGRDFEIETCMAGQTCSTGRCVAIRNTCEANQPFALSAHELTFDVSRDLKSQTKQVRLTNCGSTPLLIRDAFVRGPERPDGTAVFQLPTEFAQVFVPAGEHIDVKVTYRPTVGLSHVAGKLELSLLLDELTNIEIALRSKALCSAISPTLDFGIVKAADAPTMTGFLQNCGTEPLTVKEVEVGEGLTVQVDRGFPLTLGAREELPFVVAVAANAPLGALTSAVRFEVTELLHEPSSTVRAFVRRVDCADISTEQPEILVNNQPIVPRPGSLVRLRFPVAQEGISHWVSIAEQPDGSYEAASRVNDGWILRPRVVGTYQLEIHAIENETARVSCKTSRLEIDALPLAPVHFELTWTSDGDSIPGDLGFGHGANLDLHVLSTAEGSGQWNDPASDCFPGIVGTCGEAGGSVSISLAGGIPEIVSFQIADGMKFEVGAYLSNPFNFSGVEARLRLYVNGELHSEQHSTKLQSANDFWLVGIFDGTSGQWAPIDSTFSGFPR